VTGPELRHVEDGPADAPALLLVNSLGATLEMWEPQVSALAERFRLVRYDQRGHGGSAVPVGPYTMDDLGADAVALLDRLGIARAHVCGLSLGAMVGLWLAGHAPDRVDRIVLCGAAARLDPQRWAERAAIVRAEGTAAVADTVVGRWFTPAFAERHPELVARMRAMTAGTPAEGYASCCAAIERMDLEPILPAIRAPTLLVAGTEDPAIPPEHSYRIAATLPGAVVELLPAAHLANVEQPVAFTRLVLGHLTLETADE
jgi:3-oxoadipate enol-lactonase